MRLLILVLVLFVISQIVLLYMVDLRGYWCLILKGSEACVSKPREEKSLASNHVSVAFTSSQVVSTVVQNISTSSPVSVTISSVNTKAPPNINNNKQFVPRSMPPFKGIFNISTKDVAADPKWSFYTYALPNSEICSKEPHYVWVDHPKSTSWGKSFAYWCPFYGRRISYIPSTNEVLIHSSDPNIAVPYWGAPNIHVKVSTKPYNEGDCYRPPGTLQHILPQPIYPPNIFHMLHDNLFVSLFTLSNLGKDWEKDLPMEQVFYHYDAPFLAPNNPLAPKMFTKSVYAMSSLLQHKRICFDELLLGADYYNYENFWYYNTTQYGYFLKHFRNVLWKKFKLADDPRSNKITIIRRNNRQIVGMKEAIPLVQKEFPDWQINHVLFEGKTWAEQYNIVGTSAALIGIHAAGMTHVPFLPEDSVAVELIRWSWDRPEMKFLSGMQIYMKARSDLVYFPYVLLPNNTLCHPSVADCAKGIDGKKFNDDLAYRSGWINLGYQMSVHDVRTVLKRTIKKILDRRAGRI